MKKYELTDATIDWHGYTLRRIKACKDFVTIGGKEIHTGDLGGYVEKESNLSQYGNAWVRDDAVVCGWAVVCDSAVVRGGAVVCDGAEVCGDAVVCGRAVVYDGAEVYGGAVVCGGAVVRGDAEIASVNHILNITSIGFNAKPLTMYRTKNNEIEICCGYEVFSIESFLSRVQSWPEKERCVAEKAVELAKLHIN